MCRTANATSGALSISFRFADDTTSKVLTAGDAGSTVTVNVYGTVTGGDANFTNDGFNANQFAFYSAKSGVTGTGVTQMRNSIIVTESGLVFGAGRDNQIRAWDSESGKQLWSSWFGGNFIGSPAMYEMDGRTYLLVPAAGTAGARGGGACPLGAPAGAPPGPPAGAPMGWVAYALPSK